MANDDEKVGNRRSFFRQMFITGVEKIEETGKRMAQQFDAVTEPPAPTYDDFNYYDGQWNDGERILRPPGALAEPGFSDTCSRCGDCVKACPANAIKLIEDEAGGLPHIIARESPCVVCTDLSCMKVCPTGALQKVDSVEQIQMGYAVTDHSQCLRGEGYEIYEDETTLPGEDCQLCLTQCPVDDAIGIDGHGVVEVRHNCIGCGVCEQVCPTDPASIWVESW